MGSCVTSICGQQDQLMLSTNADGSVRIQTQLQQQQNPVNSPMSIQNELICSIDMGDASSVKNLLSNTNNNTNNQPSNYSQPRIGTQTLLLLDLTNALGSKKRASDVNFDYGHKNQDNNLQQIQDSNLNNNNNNNNIMASVKYCDSISPKSMILSESHRETTLLLSKFKRNHSFYGNNPSNINSNNNNNINSSNKRQFLYFRLPRTQYLLPRIELIPCSDANILQDSTYLKDILELQQKANQHSQTSVPLQRRVSTSIIASQFLQQIVQQQQQQLQSSSSIIIYFSKVRIYLNDATPNDMQALHAFECIAQTNKLSLHLTDPASHEQLSLILPRFRDLAALSLTFSTVFKPSNDLLLSLASMSNVLTSLKLTFVQCDGQNSDESQCEIFYRSLFAAIIAKQIVSSKSSCSPTQLQQSSNSSSLCSLKLVFIYSQTTQPLEILLDKILPFISLPNLNKLSLKIITHQEYAVINSSSVLNFLQSSLDLQTVDIYALRQLNISFLITNADSINTNQNSHTARFIPFATNRIIEDEPPSSTVPQSKHTPQWIAAEDSINHPNSMNNNASSENFHLNSNNNVQTVGMQDNHQPKQLQTNMNFTQHESASIYPSISNIPRRTSTIGETVPSFKAIGLVNQASNTASPETPLFKNSPSSGFSQLTSHNNNSSQSSSVQNNNCILTLLKCQDIRKTRKLILRDENMSNNFGLGVIQLRNCSNLSVLDLQFQMNSESQFQSLLQLLQTNTGTLKQLTLQIDKKILISLYDDQKVFSLITKMNNLISLRMAYKTKDMLFFQILQVPGLVRFQEAKNSTSQFNNSTAYLKQQSQLPASSRLASRQNSVEYLIKQLVQAKYLLHIDSPDILEASEKLDIKGRLIKLYIKQVRSRINLVYLSIHPSLRLLLDSIKEPAKNNQTQLKIGSQVLIDILCFF